MDTPSTVSVIIGVVSFLVAAFAMWQANTAARESRENFEKTRDLLAEIDKRAAVTERVVAENQRELMDTVKQLVIPEKPDMGEQLGIELLKSMFESSDNPLESIMQLKALAESQDDPTEK